MRTHCTLCPSLCTADTCVVQNSLPRSDMWEQTVDTERYGVAKEIESSYIFYQKQIWVTTRWDIHPTHQKTDVICRPQDWRQQTSERSSEELSRKPPHL